MRRYGTTHASFALISLLGLPLLAADPAATADWRLFQLGHQIYSSGYVDQPYVVALQDNAWLRVFTTGAGKEGQGGQHIVASRSPDQGRSWSEPVDIEPADGPAASWAMPYLTQYGRVYVFYDYNGDRVDTLNGRKIRNDMIGSAGPDMTGKLGIVATPDKAKVASDHVRALAVYDRPLRTSQIVVLHR